MWSGWSSTSLSIDDFILADHAFSYVDPLCNLYARRTNGVLDHCAGSYFTPWHQDRANHRGSSTNFAAFPNYSLWPDSRVIGDVGTFGNELAITGCLDGRVNTGFENVPARFQISLRRADIHPVTVQFGAVQAFADELREYLGLDRNVPIRRNEVEH